MTLTTTTVVENLTTDLARVLGLDDLCERCRLIAGLEAYMRDGTPEAAEFDRINDELNRLIAWFRAAYRGRSNGPATTTNPEAVRLLDAALAVVLGDSDAAERQPAAVAA